MSLQCPAHKPAGIPRTPTTMQCKAPPGLHVVLIALSCRERLIYIYVDVLMALQNLHLPVKFSKLTALPYLQLP